MIPPDPGELNTQVCESIKVNGQAKWNSIIGNRSKTSLPMIMNYKAVREYLGYADGRQQAIPAINDKLMVYYLICGLRLTGESRGASRESVICPLR